MVFHVRMTLSGDNPIGIGDTVIVGDAKEEITNKVLLFVVNFGVRCKESIIRYRIRWRMKRKSRSRLRRSSRVGRRSRIRSKLRRRVQMRMRMMNLKRKRMMNKK